MKSEKNYDDFLMKLAKKIKKLRIDKGLTQEDMTQHGFNYRHYQKLESGSHSPSLSTLFKVSKVFKVKISTLFE